MPISYRIWSIIFAVLFISGTSCAPNAPRDSESVNPAELSSSSLPTVQPTFTPLPQKPPRGTKVPRENQSQGGEPAQNLTFEIPEHSLDVILGRPTDTSIVLSLLSGTSQDISITYGAENSVSQTMAVSLAANTSREVVLAGLKPDTSHFYAINSGERHIFHTARAPGGAFAFDIQADSHLDSNTSPEVYGQTLTNEGADQPDFLIDLGDTFMTEKIKPYTDARRQYLAQRYFLSQVGQNSPIFLALGNHDGEGAPRGNNGVEMSEWALGMRSQYFPNPMPDSFYSGDAIPGGSARELQDYYAWEWGDALFVVLDPYWFTPSQSGNNSDPWNQTLGESQYQWLKTTLESSQAKWKFIFSHQLIGGIDRNGRGGVEAASLYEWGGHDPDGTDSFDLHRPNWGIPIHQLLVENHVTAVFHGHDHLFAKQNLDGIVYQEVPQPGSARPANLDSAAEYSYVSGDILSGPGHLRVNVSPEKVSVDFIRASLSAGENGKVTFSYTISSP